MTKFSNDFNIEDLFPDNLVEGFQDKLWSPLNSKNVVFTLYGRNALFLGMQKIANVSKKKEVLVPSYSCGDEIRAITSTGLSIRPYRVMANTQVDFDDLKSQITGETVAVLVTHYFGFAQIMIENIKDFCQSKEVYLIEDCAHSCGTIYKGRPLGSWGDLAVFSLRKSFDILHGGALVINNASLSVPDISKPPAQVVGLDMFNYLGFKNGYIQHGTPISKYLKSTTDTQDVHGARHSKIGGYSLGISNAAKFMLQYAAKNDLEERNKIFSFYLDFFSRNSNTATMPLFESIDMDTRPLFFPVLVDHSEDVCQYLRGKNIFITQPFWSHIHNMISFENYREARDLKKNIIILPLTHKIPESDLMVLVSEIIMLRKKMKNKRIKDVYLIFGPPGSGKTVQAKHLSQQMMYDYLSWGHIFRDWHYDKKYPSLMRSIKDDNTPVKTRSKKIMKILATEIAGLQKDKSDKSLILDGFLRRISEAKSFLNILKKHNYRIKAIININPSLETAHSRCESRLFCVKCRKYYDELVPPQRRGRCDEDGSRLARNKVPIEDLRSDFFQYVKELTPVIEYLRSKSEMCFDVSGDDDEIVTFSNILLKLRDRVKDSYKIYKRQTGSDFETKHGTFKMVTYQSMIDYSYHLALIKGDVRNKDGVVVRVHSSCITGDIFGSSKCDCGEQLSKSMQIVQESRCGIIFYLFQEGRGINIINKIKAYKLQRDGLDTVEANEILGFPAEMRDYTAVKDMVDDLKVKSIILLTNNPDKVNKITELGVVVQEVRPLEICPNEHNEKYLLTKKHKMNHRLTQYHK